MTSISFAICFLALTALTHIAGQQSILDSSQISYLEPLNGCYIGVLPSAASQGNLSSYVTTLGWSPAVYGTFASMPLSSEDKVSLPSFLAKMADLGAIAFVTIEPKSGLSSYGTADVQELVKMIAGYEVIGLWCILRFGHEMNGNWYAWGQQPAAYITAWRTFANDVKASTRRTALLWSPNQASEYPFGQQPYSPARGTADYNAMDTNNDGLVDMHDDPYTPFWPGDEYVDWVGLSLEYFGLFNLKNSLPIPQEFYNKITGNYNGPEGDCRAVPDFYAMFSGPSSAHQKPMAISETGLGFDVMNRGKGPSELDAKSAWWQQVFCSGGNTSAAVDVSVYMPYIKMISWLDQQKTEGSFSGDNVSWSLSSSESVASAFNSYIVQSNSAKKYWLRSAEFSLATNGIYLSTSGVGSETPPSALPFYQIPTGGAVDLGRCDWTMVAPETLLFVILGFMMLV